MSGENENVFFEKWKVERLTYKKSLRPFFAGLSAGICIGIAILCSIYLGWYQRANMEMNSQLNPIILMLAITGIAVFIAYFNRIYQWEKKEERYQAIVARKSQNDKQL